MFYKNSFVVKRNCSLFYFVQRYAEKSNYKNTIVFIYEWVDKVDYRKSMISTPGWLFLLNMNKSFVNLLLLL